MPDSVGVGPWTLYKPHDVENAKQNMTQHVWAQEIVEGWQRDVKYALGQDRNFHTVRELPDLLLGYPDPDGNSTLNPFESGHFNLAMLSVLRCLAPGNRLPVTGDTHFGTEVFTRPFRSRRFG